MKKLLIIAFAFSSLFFISCSGNGNTQGDKNIATVHASNDAIMSGDVSKLDQYIAADAVDHSGEHGEVHGLDSIKASLKSLHDDYKDMKLEALQDAANNDYVFSLTRFTGTNVVASMGAPAGTSFDMTSVEVFKFNADGKITDHWEYMTMADAMKMMGGNNEMGNMNNMNSMDTTKMDAMKH